MKNIKKVLFTFALLSLFVFSFPLPVSANSPAPADRLIVVISDLPDGAVYADLLIKIDADDSNYTDFNPNPFADDILSVKEIVDYSTDGYRSFTFHYKNAESNIKLEPYYDDSYYVNFCAGPESLNYLTQYEDLRQNYRDIKIAILDKDFKLITVSDAAKLPEEKNLFVFDGDVYYNASNGSITLEERINYFAAIFAFLYLAAMIGLSVGIELVIGLWFRFRGTPIFIVNLCSQIAMRALYVILPFTYLLETIVLETLVYLAEFFIYKGCFKQTSKAKILLYTIIANTVSLLLGICCDCLIFG